MAVEDDGGVSIGGVVVVRVRFVGSGSHVGSRDDLCSGAAVAATCSWKF